MTPLPFVDRPPEAVVVEHLAGDIVAVSVGSACVSGPVDLLRRLAVTLLDVTEHASQGAFAREGTVR